MAIGPTTNAYVSINGVPLSDHTKSVKTEDSREAKDITAMGAVNKVYTKGLGDGTFTIALYQNFATAKTHQTLQPLIGSNTPITVEIRNDNSARSATNPGAVISALLMNYSMLDVEVGETTCIEYVFQNASQAGITYPTS